MATDWPSTWPSPGSELHIFDADGDVLLVLTRSSLTNETANADNEELDYVENITSGYDEIPISEPIGGMEVDIDAELPGYVRAAEVDQIRAPSTSRLHVVTEVQMRASAIVLGLVSPVFRRMFGPNFKEGAALRAAQSVVVPLPDADPDAMVILLNIIHGRTRQVPRTMSIQDGLLTEIATLVDYYQLHEATELFADTWLRDPDRGKALQDNCEHSIALQWLWISWVFQDANLFKKITKFIEINGDEHSESIENAPSLESDPKHEYAEWLPIPSEILDTIRIDREHAISQVIDEIYGFIGSYGDNLIKHCDTFRSAKTGHRISASHRSSCDALVLGGLVRAAHQGNIWPRPKQPYDFSFESLATAIRDIDVRTLCAEMGVTHSEDTYGINTTLRTSLADIEKSLCGLDINDFMPEERRRDVQ